MAGALVVALSKDFTDEIWVVVFLSLLAALAERGSATLFAKTELSISLLPVVLAAVAIGPTEAMIVGAAAMLGTPLPLMRCLIFAAGGAITGAVAGFVALAMPDVGSAFLSAALAVTVAAATAHVADASLYLVTVALRDSSVLTTMRATAPALLVAVLLTATVVTPLAYAYAAISPWSIWLFVPPAIAAQRLFGLYQEQRELAERLTAANQRLERASLSFARSLVAALDARDRYTAGHSAAVGIYSRDIAAALGFTEASTRQAHLAGLLHDIGKVGLPPEVLEKPGPLTPDERLRMEEHPVIGETILRNVEDYDEIATIVRHHHERVDGHGYPDGIVGDQIPMVSRIICAADAYNAMTSGRPYRGALPVHEALRRLQDGAGTQFDAEVVTAFLGVLERGGDLYARGATADFALEAQAHPELDEVEASAA